MQGAINEWLRQFPKTRKILIRIFLYINYLVLSVKNKLSGRKTGILTNGIRLTPIKKHCFFGYYDKSPFNDDGTKYIFHRVKTQSMPAIGEYAEIVLKEMDGEEKILGKTLAWNLQQGSMLQFINNEIVFWNDFRKGEYCSVFFNISNGIQKIYGIPIYDIHSPKEIGLSIDFERLNIDAPGYGYIQKGIKSFSQHTWIKLIDIDQNKDKEIINTKQLCEQFPDEKFDDDVFHYFNHLKFNPSGNRFIFLHRFVYKGKRHSRMFTSDLGGKNIHKLAGDEMVSHFTWKNDEQILVWCKHNKGNHYYLINDISEEVIQIVGELTLLEDGHPTYSDDLMTLITDTYPDKACLRHLIIYNCKTGISTDIARLYAPIRLNGPTRCDLHPRWHPNQNMVCIDSVHESFRGMYLISCLEDQ